MEEVNRKIDAEIYCPSGVTVIEEGTENCDHDFERTISKDEWAEFKCTKCGRTVRCDVWN